MRCPVCRAENAAGPTCRRCRADLSLLFDLEERRAHALAAAERSAARGAGGEVVRFAGEAHRLRRGEDSRRLLALGHLLRRDFAGAWQTYWARD
jgi:hypothetical protein